MPFAGFPPQEAESGALMNMQGRPDSAPPGRYTKIHPPELHRALGRRHVLDPFFLPVPGGSRVNRNHQPFGRIGFLHAGQPAVVLGQVADAGLAPERLGHLVNQVRGGVLVRHQNTAQAHGGHVIVHSLVSPFRNRRGLEAGELLQESAEIHPLIDADQPDGAGQGRLRDRGVRETALQGVAVDLAVLQVADLLAVGEVADLDLLVQ